jgi:hypothetical protein
MSTPEDWKMIGTFLFVAVFWFVIGFIAGTGVNP